MKEANLKGYIRDIPDFPKKGIIFKDITPLLQDKAAFKNAIKTIVSRYKNTKIDAVVGMESRGFIFASAVAYGLNVGFVPVRKKGKLPYKTKRASYELEYGSDSIEIHTDAIKKGQKVLIVDDLIATGGTTSAVISLIESLGGEIVGIEFLIELLFLKGRERIKYPINSIIKY